MNKLTTQQATTVCNLLDETEKLLAKLEQTHETFQTQIAALAIKYDIRPVQGYAYWLEYSEMCNGDQPPVFSEFESWYESKWMGV